MTNDEFYMDVALKNARAMKGQDTSRRRDRSRDRDRYGEISTNE